MDSLLPLVEKKVEGLVKALQDIRGKLKEANSQKMYGSEMDDAICDALEISGAALSEWKGK